MPIPLQQAVETALAPHAASIVSVVRSAWSDWLSSGYAAVWRCKRSRANFVWEQIIEAAHREFLDGGIVPIKENESFGFLVNRETLFRFKKADDVGYSSNVPTQLAMAYHDHDVDLFGLPAVSRVEVVYQLNRLETQVADIAVVARDGRHVAWSYSLLDAEPGVVELPLPVAPVEPRRAVVRPRTTGKNGSQSAS